MRVRLPTASRGLLLRGGRGGEPDFGPRERWHFVAVLLQGVGIRLPPSRELQGRQFANPSFRISCLERPRPKRTRRPAPHRRRAFQSTPAFAPFIPQTNRDRDPQTSHQSTRVLHLTGWSRKKLYLK